MSNLVKEYSRRKIGRAYASALVVICLCTTVLSYMGYRSLWPDSFEGKLLATMIAVGTFAALYLYHSFVMQALIDSAPLKNRLAVLALALMFTPFIIGLSSAINVAAISGRAAQDAYLNDFERQASSAVQDIYSRASAVRRFLSLFEQQQKSWAQAAEDEKRNGAFSRSGGGGGVHRVLLAYAGEFEKLIQQTNAFLVSIDALNERALEELLAIREIGKEDNSYEERMAEIAKHADQLKQILTKMQALDLIEGFKISVHSLPDEITTITLSKNPRIAAGQREAITKITARLVNSIQMISAEYERYLGEKQPEMPSLRPISTLSAVVEYWDLFPQGWLAGLALDFLPLFLAVVLLLLKIDPKNPDRNDDERKTMTVEELLRAQKAIDELNRSNKRK